CSLVAALFVSSSAPHTAPTATYTLSLHDALPISRPRKLRLDSTRIAEPTLSAERMMIAPVTLGRRCFHRMRPCPAPSARAASTKDRKSTRLNSSHVKISYAVFCLKKKNNPKTAQY